MKDTTLDRILQKFSDSMEEIEFFKGRTNVLLKKWPINLAVAGTQTIDIAGNFVYAIDATGATANVNIQFSKREDDMDKYNLVKSLGIIYPFDKIICSWDAQAGANITLWVGNQSPNFLQVIDNRSAAASDTYLAQLVDKIGGATTPATWAAEIDIDVASEKVLSLNANRKSAILQADVDNTSFITIGFDNTVSDTKYVIKLEAGDIFVFSDYLGELWAYGGAANQLLVASED